MDSTDAALREAWPVALARAGECWDRFGRAVFHGDRFGRRTAPRTIEELLAVAYLRGAMDAAEAAAHGRAKREEKRA